METSLRSGDPIAPASSQPARVDWQGIGLFLLLTFGISWSLWLGLRAMGISFTIRAAIGMFGPALGALLTRLIRREGFADAGLGLRAKGQRGASWMYLAAYVVPPILIAASIGFVLLVGYEHWDLNQHLHTLANALQTRLGTRALQLGMSTTQLATISLISQIVLAFTLGLPFNMIFTFGEEFGWRGYLLPRLAPLGGLPAAILVGLVWGFWHAPLIVLDGYNYPGHPWLGILMMMLFTVLLSIIFAWLRFRSGSVWPSTLAHAAFNAQANFEVLALSRGNSLLSAPIGLFGLVPMFCFALVLVVTRRVNWK
ncbi:abortive infection protein [Ktedonobacter sp. SOSP1-52]|uniref:CPBP family intramembrane glutamic endopeptidase n=1 Tax=Ktedonobacter sp. SOSP1-52 TaxID=2778366 RepID=UPI00191572EF|nr:CPBP family intramembrane glutamic endopeptidase [Ktedonobacter sp. SOSP1-52]GHO70797.1 abortive infection protein [Ktedonobacter sp. SOSP1-52]